MSPHMTCRSVNTIIKCLKDCNDCKREEKKTLFIFMYGQTDVGVICGAVTRQREKIKREKLGL